MFDLKRVSPVHPPHAFLMDHWIWVVGLIVIAGFCLWSMTYFDSGIWDVIGIFISCVSFVLLVFLIIQSIMLTQMGTATYEGEFKVVDVEQTSNNIKEVTIKVDELKKTFDLNTKNYSNLENGQTVVLQLNKEGYFKSKDDVKSSYKLSDSLENMTIAIKDVKGNR